MNKLTALVEAAKAATPGPWEWIAPEDDSPWDGRGYASLRTVERYGEDKTEIRNGLHYTSFALPKFIIGAEGIEHIPDASFIALTNPTTILELCALLEKAEEALYHSVIASGGETGCEHALGICFCKENEALAAIKQWKEQP